MATCLVSSAPADAFVAMRAAKRPPNLAVFESFRPKLERSGQAIDRQSLDDAAQGRDHFLNNRRLDQPISRLRKRMEYDVKKAKDHRNHPWCWRSL